MNWSETSVDPVWQSGAGLLQKWDVPELLDGEIWIAPAGTTVVLDIDGDAEQNLAPELMWSTRAGALGATRAIVFFSGPGKGVVTDDFEDTHRVAEALADLLSVREQKEVGPIEVLCFRPDAIDSVQPSPHGASTNVEYEFIHRGGARVRLTLSIPPIATQAVESET